jgi:hypothetical protein
VTLQIVASLMIVIDNASYGYEAKLVSSITIVSIFIVQASFTSVTYDRQNIFIIQATDHKTVVTHLLKTLPVNSLFIVLL